MTEFMLLSTLAAAAVLAYIVAPAKVKALVPVRVKRDQNRRK